MKVALVHDWLTGMRGGERCLESFLEIYPEADVYALFHVPGTTSSNIDNRVAGVSQLNSLPGVAKYYRALLPLFPYAVRSIQLRAEYDLVISLSHAAAKNVAVPEGAMHICYCFTPMRYIWDQAESYFGKLTPLLSPLIRYLRRWDRAGSLGVDRFVGISSFVAARIRRFYGRKADVIFPPVETAWIAQTRSHDRSQPFLYAGALVPYKRVELIIDAFVKSGLPLIIAGSGPLESSLRDRAAPNISFVGRVSDQELARLYSSCRALIFAAREDFGMIPVEAMASGAPVIACYDGALRESIKGVCPWLSGPIDFAGATGVFFQSPRVKSRKTELLDALSFFLQHEEEFRVEDCISHAEKFSTEKFRLEWDALVSDLLGQSSDTSPPSPLENYAQAEASAF